MILHKLKTKEKTAFVITHCKFVKIIMTIYFLGQTANYCRRRDEFWKNSYNEIFHT
jgi:hypothetical protein